MKIVFKFLITGGLMIITSVASAAESPFSANVALTSDYVFRGISQTSEDPAIQGGFDFNHASGFYIGVWASALNFGEDATALAIKPADRAHLEVDIYAGFSGNFTEKMGWDIGVLNYGYPGAASSLNYDFTEAYAKLNYDFGVAKTTLAVNQTSDYFAASGSATYIALDVEVPLPSDFALAIHAGNQKIDKNAAFATPDYTDYKIGISKEFGGFGFALDWIDTDLDKIECFGGSDLCESRVVFTISKGM
jgi:uncharacterized protein (TIGR02001 family)